MYHLSVLPGGLRVASARLPFMQSVSLGVFPGIGSRHESPAQAGISHFLEHMLFKGTERRSVRDIAVEVEGSGGTLNAYTGEEYTCYEARGPAELLPLMADVVTDMVLRPIFPEDELERERDVILEEIAMYRENPSDHVHELAARALWGEHPLGRSILGTKETLEAMGRNDLVKFHRNTYRTHSHLLAVAGPHSHEEVVALAERLYEGIRLDRPVPVAEPVDPAKVSPETLRDQRDMEQSHIVLSYASPGSTGKERHALRLLSVLMGESMSSRLFQEVREKRGLAYSIYSDLSLYRDCGSFSIYAGVDSDKRDLALATIREEIDKILHDGCTREELDQAKRYALGQMTVMMDSTAGQLGWIGESVMQYGDIIPPHVTRVCINEVAVEDIARAAELLFREKQPALAIVGG